MPNWAKGYLRVRGKTSDIFNFIENGMMYVGEVFDDGYKIIERQIKINREAFGEELYVPLNNEVFGKDVGSVRSPAIYINGTHRNFIRYDIDECINGRDEISTIVFSKFQAAWGVDAAPYEEISKKYNIEIKIDVYERGMRFSQHIHIKDGKADVDQKREYDNWSWECPCPDFGG